MKAKKPKSAFKSGMGTRIKKSKPNLKGSKPVLKSILKNKNHDTGFKSSMKKKKPLIYKDIQSSKEDLDTSHEEPEKAFDLDMESQEQQESKESSDMDEIADVSEEFDEDEDEDEGDEHDEDEGDEDEGEDHRVITLAMIQKWGNDISIKRDTISAFKNIHHALTAALDSIESGNKGKKKQGVYVLRGSQLFNAVVCVCIKNVPAALYDMFAVKSLSDTPEKNKKWKKFAGTLKHFLKDFTSLMAAISEPSALGVLLKKGVLALLPFYAEFPVLSWQLTRHLATLWCTSHEKVRVLALVALFRLIRSFGEDKRDKALKLLYISYVSNCRFTSPSTWPVIHFMRSSLAELYSMDQICAYRHSFVYIRQLAIHLRNAMLVQKQERLQLVYNWQFVHCLHLWTELLAKSHPSAILQPMIYPLTQVANGVMKLQNSPKYFPLTFHICDILTEMSLKTNTFIPVLPHLLEILSSHHLYKTAKKNSLKPFQWDCMIKMAESQMNESAFVEGLVDKIFDSSITYLNTQCCTIAFPELVIPMKMEIQVFKKKCKSVDLVKKMNQLLLRVNENAAFIDNRRKNVSFVITDREAIKNWEIEVEQSTPPLRTFFLRWKAMNDEIKRREAASEVSASNVDELSISAVRKRQNEENDEFGKVDDVEEANVEEPKTPKSKTEQTESTKGSKTSRQLKEAAQDNVFESDESGDEDIVTEMKLSDCDMSDSDELNSGNKQNNDEGLGITDDDDDEGFGITEDDDDDDELGITDDELGITDDELGITDDDDEQLGITDDDELGITDDDELGIIDDELGITDDDDLEDED